MYVTECKKLEAYRSCTVITLERFCLGATSANITSRYMSRHTRRSNRIAVRTSRYGPRAERKTELVPTLYKITLIPRNCYKIAFT